MLKTKVILTRIPDDSAVYEYMKEWEKTKSYTATGVFINYGRLYFTEVSKIKSKANRKHAVDLTYWDAQFIPIK